jgi:hypothetical protein
VEVLIWKVFVPPESNSGAEKHMFQTFEGRAERKLEDVNGTDFLFGRYDKKSQMGAEYGYEYTNRQML